MPSAVALLLCAGCVVFLLRKEQALAPPVSGATWIPTLWMLHFAGKPIARWMNPSGVITESPADRVFLTGLMAMGLVLMVRRGIKGWNNMRDIGWLALLVGYLLVSCLWSDDIGSSLKQWSRVFGTMLMGLVILGEKDPRAALGTILVRHIYLLIPLSVVLIKYYPELGVEYRSWNGEKFWVGAALQKNGLGRLCLVSGVFLGWKLMARRSGEGTPAGVSGTLVIWLMLGILGWLLNGPGSNRPMTAIGVLGLCLCVLMGLLLTNRTRSGRWYSGFAIGTVASAIGLAGMSITGMIPTLGNATLGRDATFTGRSYIWDVVRQVGWQHAIQGVGYSGYWVRHREFPVVGIVNEGHNGYLDVFVETGLTGVGLLLAMTAAFARQLNRDKHADYPWACLGLVYLFMAVIHNFTETSFLRSSAHIWVLLIYMYVVLMGSRPDQAVRQVGRYEGEGSGDLNSRGKAIAITQHRYRTFRYMLRPSGSGIPKIQASQPRGTARRRDGVMR
jgi:exopolysaccharide production protein ExoQ